MLDVVAEEHGEPLALGPVIDRPLGDRDVVVAVVGGEFHDADDSSLVASPSPLAALGKPRKRHEIAPLRSQ